MILTEVSNAGEPIQDYELADHLRIDCKAEQLSPYIKASRRAAEAYTHRSFTETQYTTTLNGFCFPFELPIGPINQVDSIEYYDENDSLQPFTAFTADNTSTFPVIDKVENTTLPDVYDKPESVIITFTTTGSAPDDVKAAIFLIAGHLYENRENEIVGQSVSQITMNAQWLLNHHRIYHK